MNKTIARLSVLIDQYLYKTKHYIEASLSKPLKKSDDFVWSYRYFGFNIINYEILFVFDEDIVVDIVICEYFLWVELRNTFYFEGETLEYRIIELR